MESLPAPALMTYADLSPAEAEMLLLQAVNCPLGLLLRTNDIPRLKARLYAARKASPDFVELQIRTSAVPDGDLMVVRKRPDSQRLISELSL